MISFFITNINKCAGTERVVTSQVNYLVQQGKRVEIISLNSIEGGAFFDLDNSVVIHHLGVPTYENAGLLKKIIGYIESFVVVKSFFRSYKTDLVIGTSRNTNIMAIVNNRGTRVIGCEHFQYYNPKPLIRVIRDYFYKKLEKLIVLTKRDQEIYIKKGISAVCIPNAVSFPVQKNIKEKSKIAVAVGRHSYEKNFELLLRLWKRVDSKDWTLQIIGEGPLYEDNKSYAEKEGIKNVEFIPFTKDIVNYYRQASIYLMTSRFEALPMVLLEAKTCGCVCVSFDCETGPREIIRNGVDGFLIPLGQDDEYINRVEQLMNDPDLCKKMGNEALDSSYLYSKEVLLKKLLNIV